MRRSIFPKGTNDKGEPFENLRWSRVKHFEAREMMRTVDEHVSPSYRLRGKEGAVYGTHMKVARFSFSNPNLLANSVQILDKIPTKGRDTKGYV